MLIRLLLRLGAVSPGFRRLLWNRWYQHLAGYANPEWRFMNYGYVALDPGEESLALVAEDEPNRLAIQLYHRVARAVDLSGRRVLEVGCGRGGGASFLQRYHRPVTLTAVDRSPRAIRLCRRLHAVEGLTFEPGDAEALPFDDASFDAVVNVESSHCYGSMPAFLGEVTRVLRPGGHFLFADLRVEAECGPLDRELQEAGLTILERQEITPNVLEALRRDSERKARLIGEAVPGPLAGTFRQFAGIEGSKVFDNFESGRMRYLRYLARR